MVYDRVIERLKALRRELELLQRFYNIYPDYYLEYDIIRDKNSDLYGYVYLKQEKQGILQSIYVGKYDVSKIATGNVYKNIVKAIESIDFLISFIHTLDILYLAKKKMEEDIEKHVNIEFIRIDYDKIVLDILKEFKGEPVWPSDIQRILEKKYSGIMSKRTIQRALQRLVYSGTVVRTMKGYILKNN